MYLKIFASRVGMLSFAAPFMQASIQICQAHAAKRSIKKAPHPFASPLPSSHRAYYLIIEIIFNFNVDFYLLVCYSIDKQKESHFFMWFPALIYNTVLYMLFVHAKHSTTLSLLHTLSFLQFQKTALAFSAVFSLYALPIPVPSYYYFFLSLFYHHLN